MKHVSRFIYMAVIAAAILLPGGMDRCAADVTWIGPDLVTSSAHNIAVDIALTYGAGGKYHLIFSDDTTDDIMYSALEPGGWSALEQVTPAGFGTLVNMALSNWVNVAAVVYYDIGDGELKYATSWASWSPDGIDGTAHARFVDFWGEDGNIHVAYIDEVEAKVKYAYMVGTTVHIEDVANVDVFNDTIAIDRAADGTTHIAWYDHNQQKIKHALRQGPDDFKISEPADASYCVWLDMKVMSDGVPFIGFLDWTATTDRLAAAYKVGGWFDMTILDAPAINHVAMAAATEEGLLSDDIYFACSRDAGISYIWMDGGHWVETPLPGAGGMSSMATLGMAWNPEDQEIGLVLGDHSTREVHFWRGIPHMGPEDLAVDLVLNASVYHGGDTMSLVLDVSNPGAARSADFYVLLEVFGEFWFYPGWTNALDHFTASLADLASGTYTILAPFPLPDPLDAGGPFYFHAAAFEPGTLDIGTLISNIESELFEFR
ncbi:hypothetical protein JW905_16080 [bacterium]|nr:hypothetical protein [candidate division CSSED10-310 bacterium]